MVDDVHFALETLTIGAPKSLKQPKIGHYLRPLSQKKEEKKPSGTLRFADVI